jgi:ABC-type Mn2+/Zn2+ transport system permease subunit
MFAISSSLSGPMSSASLVGVDLFKPFQFEFFRNGVIVATLAGALCGVVGCYVVLRNMSYIGHGLSHAIFGGYAVAGLIGINLFLGAGAWGVLTALTIGAIVRRRPIGSDAAIGVVTTSAFAFGLAIIQIYGSPSRNADALLFGNVLGVTWADVWLIVAVSIGALVFIFVGYRQLLFTTFDAEVARATGVRTNVVDALLMVLLSATVLATMNVMGVTLVAANLVVPAVVARMLTDSFATMLLYAGMVGAVSGFVGMNASYHLDVASGPTIVLTAAAFFILAFVAGGSFRRRAGGVGHAH